MTDDREIEDVVERFLADTARPMPSGLLEDTLRDLPSRDQRRRGPLRLPRRAPLTALATATVVAFAVGLAGPVLFRPSSQPGVLPSGALSSPALSPTAGPTSSPALAWDPAAEYRSGADHANPSPDRYGHPDVWGYRYAPLGTHPSAMTLMVFDPANGTWHVPGVTNLTIYRQADAIVLHPAGSVDGNAATLTWSSPVTGTVNLGGGFVLGDPGCTGLGTGVTVEIRRDLARLWGEEVATGGGATFDLSVPVEPGTQVSFAVGAGVDADCDSTFLRLSIETR